MSRKAKYKGETVRVNEVIGGRANIWIPSEQRETWVLPKSLRLIRKK